MDNYYIQGISSVSEWLVKEISFKINKPHNEIDIHAPFSHIGIQSMELLGIVAKLGKQLNLEFPSTIGFDYPTIHALSYYLENNSDNHDSLISPPIDHFGKNGRALCNASEFSNQQPIPERMDHASTSLKEPIAVIGIGCRFPGGCDTHEKFWKFLENGENGITKVPPDRWDVEALYDANPDTPGKMTTKWGGFINQIDQFDPVFFGISPREAKGMDPQQRVIMEVGWETLEDAGEIPSQLKGSKTGVFVGISGSDYGRLLFKDPAFLDLYSGTGNSTSIVPNRLSYFLGLHGPSIAVDTACSSSLVAVHLACQSLNNIDCNLALAGGVNLILSPEMTIIFSKARLMAQDGQCKTFDASADGYVRSEGCGMVALKRYSDALRDNDRIYGLIRTTHINQDGESNGLTVPNGLSQEMLIKDNLRKAGLAPSQINYAETHGTGTAIGDPIEVNALGKVLGQKRSPTAPLVLGSVKTNIGHLEQAAGIAGLIKVLLSLKNHRIPPHLHLKKVNPLISLDKIPAVIPNELMSWEPGQNKRIATVSGFSFGGVNANLIVEEAAPSQQPDVHFKASYHLLTLSAKDQNALIDMAQQYKQYLHSHPDTDPEKLSYTANARRTHFPWRLALAGKDTKELEKGLSNFVTNPSFQGVMTGKAKPGIRPAFIFTGQGSQYPNMGQILYQTQPLFRKEMDRCNEILTQTYQIPLLSLIYGNSEADLLNQTANTQPALFCLEYSMARMYQAWGIEPSFVMGHSVGEFVAACLAGIFTLEDGLKLISARGRLIQNLPLGGKMAVLLTDLTRVENAIVPFDKQVSIAAINGPANIVISGEGAAVERICRDLSSREVQSVILPVSHAFHSPLMEPMIEEFRKVAAEISYKKPRIPYVSNITGRIMEDNDVCSPDYWCRHIRLAVMFESSVRTLHQHGCDLFLEIGPSPVLSGMARSILPKDDALFAPSLKRGVNDLQSIMDGLGILYTQSVAINWKAFYPSGYETVLSIPTYPFQRKRYWYKAPDHNQSTVLTPGITASGFHPSKGARLATCLKETIYHYTCNTKSHFLNEHRVYNHAVMSSSTMASMIICCMEEMFGKGVYHIDNMFLRESLYVPDDDDVNIQVVFDKKGPNKVNFKIFSAIQHDEQSKLSWNMHTEGMAEVIQANATSPSSDLVFSPQTIRKRCSEELSSESLYRLLNDSGLELGHHFKWLEHIWRKEREAFAQMRLSDPGEECQDDRFPPGLIDSCVQLLFACFSPDKDAAYMFLGFDSFTFYGRLSGKVLCHMVLQSESSERNLVVGDYQLWNENKEIIAEAKGVHVKQAPLETFMKTKGETLSSFYGMTWQVSDPKTVNPDLPGTHSGKWLILADSHEVGLSLTQAFESKDVPYEFLCREKSSEPKVRANENTVWRHANEIESLISKHLQQEKYSGILNLCGINQSMSETLFHGPLVPDMHAGCLTTLPIIKALSRFTQSDLPKLWLVTSGVQVIESGEIPANLIQSPLWGMGKVLALEHPEFFGGLVDLSPGAEKIEFLNLIQELIHSDGENFISLRGDKRFLARVQPFEEDTFNSTPCSLSKDATYLITGGLGGLGIGLAKWLSEKGAGHLVLMGRNTPSPEAENNIREIEKKNVEVRVLRGDVSNATDLEKMFKEIAQTMPPLKGIFHLAGVLDDGMLHQLEWNRFMQVISPKVQGAWNLHLLTKHMDLDHFVLFSSIASLLGSPGQGSYAAGNYFMDTLAHLRQGGGLPALSLNWGPWSGVGMAAQLNSADLQRWEKGGVTPLSFDQGFSFFKKLLGSDRSQVGVLPIDWHTYVQHYLNNSVSPLLSSLVTQNENRSAQPKSVALAIKEQINNAKPEEKNFLVSKYIMNHIKEVMSLDENFLIDPDIPLIEMGLDSLMVVELRNRFKIDFGVNISLNEFLKTPTLGNISEIVLARVGESKHTESDDVAYPKIIRDADHVFEPFPLTDIQHAYWMGRNGSFSLGNVSCHVYLEVEIANLYIDRLNAAVSKLVERHEMLRAVVLSDGRQQILNHAPEHVIKVKDMRGLKSGQIKKSLNEMRYQMSHQILPSETGPLFEIRASVLDGEITRLHISCDLLIGDGWSFNILIKDLSQYYFDPEANLPPIEINFRDYVLTQEKIKNSDLYQHDMAYWKELISQLPPAPELPLQKKPDEIKDQRFIRLQSRMEKDRWQNFKKRAAKIGLTPSGILLAAFSEILARWSKSPDFTITLTMFNRLPLHPQVNEIVGDFTTLTLLEINHDGRSSFETRARKIQEKLWEDLEHRHVSGVEVLRELNRQNSSGSAINFPVVFTSALPYTGSSDNASSICLPDGIPIKPIYCISQTPQVWLDHQIYEQNGNLSFVWDVVEGIFPEGMLDDMFESYCRLIDHLANEENFQLKIPLLSDTQIKIKKTVNNTGASISEEMLHTLFNKQACRQPERVAVLTPKLTMSYDELANRSQAVGEILWAEGALPNTLVGIVMEKGWEQVVAVLGTLYSGAAYLPIEPSLPRERIHHILENGDVNLVLTQSWLENEIDWPEGIKRFSVDQVSFSGRRKRFIPLQTIDDLAYVIYTSGSTGLPKGVMIDHKGAVNTILDINERFSIGPQDKVLALAELNFDLSVYDIFGSLAAGGAIVIPSPDEKKDPAHWFELMNRTGVTVWNSVPAMMSMLTEYLSVKPGFTIKDLRVILLSGDKIPVTLPKKIEAITENANTISLGGATEASIWSILFPVTEHKQSKTIPYGRPMRNQKFYVLNKTMEDCPVWVPGDLYISGVGLSTGYWKDTDRTENSFIQNEHTGERVYKTGDIGRYLPDGNIEFLGRDDFQVKIAGYRIELGEIEEMLKGYPGVQDAIVSVQSEKHLAAYLVASKDLNSFEAKVKTYLKEKLPDYMIPEFFVQMEIFPLNQNGKVDRKRLPAINRSSTQHNKKVVPPGTWTEKDLFEIWQNCLNTNDFGIEDNFFSLGGDSISAVRLINQINDKFLMNLTIKNLMQHPNIKDFADFIETVCVESERNTEVEEGFI
jgi:amino acid adenylation domain-containing protein